MTDRPETAENRTDLPRMTIFDACVYLNVDRKTIYRWVLSGKLKAYKRAGRVFFYEDDLKRLYEPKEVKADVQRENL